MIWFLMFLGLVLSVVKANGWIVIPTFCIVFCWGVSIVCWLIYSYSKGLAAGLKDQVAKAKSNKKKEPTQPIEEKAALERLGDFGKLFLDYNGCPRGPTGRAAMPLVDEVLLMHELVDVDGGIWIPVNADALHELVEKYVEREQAGRCRIVGKAAIAEHLCGPEGALPECPRCGAKSPTWDPDSDVRRCTKCGWDDAPCDIGKAYPTGGYGYRCFDGEKWHDCDKDGAIHGWIHKAVKQPKQKEDA